jgi:hypothetical protein
MSKRSYLAALLALAAPACAESPDATTGTAGEALTAQAPQPAAHAKKAKTPERTWQPLTNPPSFAAGLALQLTDGSVMVQDVGSPNWWRLTPDASGSYVDGTWSQLPSLPDGYSPLYFASAVLPDGRVIVEGGEYQNFTPAWTTQGAIFDPVANTWTAVAPPAGWTTIGDAQSVVLTNGLFMLANCCTTEAAILDPKTLTWTATGTGKADINDEEGWTLLPDGTVLTVDANNTTTPNQTELYTPARRRQPAQWTSAGQTPVALADLDADGGGSHELGPQVLRPDGTVIAFGATGHNAIYDTRTKAWSSAPDFPIVSDQGQLDVADGPAALMPNGTVLVATSPTVFNTPTHFFEVDGAEITEVTAPPSAALDSSYNQNLLVLPTGEILLTDFGSDVEIYTPAKAKHHAIDRIAPQIWFTPILVEPGQTYPLIGQRLNGVSQAVAYGDDAQAATNYPLVRITNLATGHVAYARTHDHTTMSIAKDAIGATQFDVPAGAEAGWSVLEVVANGVPSLPMIIDVDGTDVP